MFDDKTEEVTDLSFDTLKVGDKITVDVNFYITRINTRWKKEW